jgi:cysteinyl-tRNA synthetase
LERLRLATGSNNRLTQVEERLFQLKKDVMTALDDDLNISKALAPVFACVAELNQEMDQGLLGESTAAAVASRFAELDEIFGIMNPPQAGRDAALESLLQEREAARQRRDWAAADRIREELARQGIEVIDTPAGPRWRRRP